MRQFFKRLFCKHEYEFEYSYLIQTGSRKLIAHKCKLCGKRKIIIY